MLKGKGLLIIMTVMVPLLLFGGCRFRPGDSLEDLTLVWGDYERAVYDFYSGGEKRMAAVYTVEKAEQDGSEVMLMRNLPMETGYKKNVNLAIVGSGQVAPYQVEVEGLETVEVPYGTIVMFSLWTILSALSTLMLALVLPIVAAIWFCRRYQVRPRLVWLGALTFTVFQLILRIPLLQLLVRAYPGITAWPVLLNAFFLASTAAFFEEGGRWLIFSKLYRGRAAWSEAAAFGIGHGGFEAISLVGITYISNLLIMLLVNAGLGEVLGPLQSGALLLMQYPSHVFLLAGIERVLAMLCHIGFSVLVVLGIARKQFRYILYAFAAHTLLNLPIGPLQQLSGGLWLVMGYLFLFALGITYWWMKEAPGRFPGRIDKEASI